MDFVISVLPISITSGALPPASVASNFARWVPPVWYCTSTSQPGLCASHCARAPGPHPPAPALGRRLDRRARGRTHLGPAGLSVDLEPDGQRVGRTAAGSSAG